MDLDAMMVMDKKEFEKYDNDLAERRFKACNRGLVQQDKDIKKI
jgi:hypothetical protein